MKIVFSIRGFRKGRINLSPAFIEKILKAKYMKIDYQDGKFVIDMEDNFILTKKDYCVCITQSVSDNGGIEMKGGCYFGHYFNMSWWQNFKAKLRRSIILLKYTWSA